MVESSFTKRAALLCHVLCLALLAGAQIPQGYYSSAKGSKGSALKTALFKIVSSHTARSYSDLWEDFKTTDVRDDGKIWDMYSNATSYTPGGPQQGVNASSEGESYNREHSFPKSWFNDATPMYTDLFHLYPTDSYVNNRRSNYPFGETKGERYQSAGGFSKVGNCTVEGYSGIVFEPADEYKGDFARTYFYMATAYEDRIASWSCDMLAGNKYPAYADWALTMLLRWAAEDPVSEKEKNRNEAVYSIQHNRNPYIDFPGLEQYVWGNWTTTAFDPDNYETPVTPPSETVEKPEFTPAGGNVAAGTEVTITCATEGAVIHYAVNGADEEESDAPVTLVIDQTTTITAYATANGHTSTSVTATFTVSSSGETGNTLFQLMTDGTELKQGLRLIVVSSGKSMALGSQEKKYRQAVEVSITDGESITTETGGAGQPTALVLGGSTDAWTLCDEGTGSYLTLTSSSNELTTTDDATSEEAQWSIRITQDGTAEIVNAKRDDRSIQYNASAPRFACYASRQQSVSIFCQQVSQDIANVVQTQTKRVDVYDATGRLVRRKARPENALDGLPQGFYVVGGKKCWNP